MTRAAKESDLCADFRDAAESDGWVVYPERAGWDLVLVWPGEAPVPSGATLLEEGSQVGVEAKLRANADVLAQAIGHPMREGPDYRAVLVPKASEAFVAVARAIGLGVYTYRHCGSWRYRGGWERPRKTVAAPARHWAPRKRLWLPPVVPRHAAGVPSPRPLTPWRVRALRLCHRLRHQGYVTTQDFRELGLSMDAWRDRWVRRQYPGRGAVYVMVPGAELPDAGFESDRDAIVGVDTFAKEREERK